MEKKKGRSTEAYSKACLGGEYSGYDILGYASKKRWDIVLTKQPKLKSKGHCGLK